MDEHRKAVVVTGLLTRLELRTRGITDREIRAAVRAGQLVKVSYGVYGRPRASSDHPIYPTSGRDFELQQQEHRRQVCSAALRADDPLLSHVSAAMMFGLPLVEVDLDVVHLIGRLPSGGQRRGRVFRHPGRPGIPEVRVDGMRVTSAARTLVDIGRTESFDTAVTAIDAALRRGLVSRTELTNEVTKAARTVGAAAARRAVAFGDGRSESPGESRTRTALQELGFPPPDLQVKIFSAIGEFIGRVDLAYPEWGVLIEFDGLVKYGDLPDGPDARAAVIAEKRREDRLRAAGFVVLRLTWKDLADRDRLRRLVSDALENGRRAVAAGMITGVVRAA